METRRARRGSLSLCQAFASFPGSPLPLPWWDWYRTKLPSLGASTPRPLPFLQQPDHFQVCVVPQRQASGGRARLGAGRSAPWAAGSRAPAQPTHGSAPIPPSFHSPPPTISSLLSHSLPSDPWVLNYNWDPGNAFLSTIFMGWADTFN